MAKSVRSKWKKRMNKAKTEAAKPQLMQRISNLNNKLDLVSQNKISTVPMQDPCPFFHHQHPGVDGKTPLKLQGFTTNIRKGLRGFEGNVDGSNEIRSAKKTQAEYHPLASQVAAAVKSAKTDDANALYSTSGGFVQDDDDEQVPQEDNNEGNSKQTVLAKAADIKKTAAKKLKSSEPTGTRTRLVAGGKKQTKYNQK